MNFNLHDLKLGFESLFVFGEGVDTPKTQEQLPIIKKKGFLLLFILLYLFIAFWIKLIA
jgi:hypothetical protein